MLSVLFYYDGVRRFVLSGVEKFPGLGLGSGFRELCVWDLAGPLLTHGMCCRGRVCESYNFFCAVFLCGRSKFVRQVGFFKKMTNGINPWTNSGAMLAQMGRR